MSITNESRDAWSMTTPDEARSSLLDGYFVVCHTSLVSLARQHFPHLIPAFSHQTTEFLSGKPEHSQALPSTTTLHYRRLMDRFYLMYSSEVSGYSRDMEVAFFDFCAREYDHMIDLANNTAMIEILFNLVEATRSSQPTLDFGCGPAVSMPVARRLGIRVVGYDPSARMQSLAQLRGMEIFSIAGSESSGLQYGAMIASYVLHLTIGRPELCAALRCLAPGGKFAANFHKGINVKRIEALVGSTGLCSQLDISDSTHDRHHGEIRLWRKNDG